MTLLETLTLLFFLVGATTMFVKLANVISYGELLDKGYIFITFILSIFSWGIVFLGNMWQHNLEYAIVFNIANAVFLISVMLTLAEVFLIFKNLGDHKTRGRKISDLYRRR